MLRRTICAFGFVLVSGTTAFTQAPPGPEKALQYRPAQTDVEYDRPTVKDVPKCTVKLERAPQSGFTVYDPNGQILRRYVDTNKDGYVDQFRYFRNGIEVYRDIDANFNTKIDQSRWLNTAGSRWAVDSNEDGRIDGWKILSAEEASRIAISAMTANDASLLATVLISQDDISKLGITDEFSTKLLQQVQEPAAAIRTVLSGSKSLTKQSKWSRFDAAMPGIIPADDGKASQDLVVYESAMAIVETSGQHSFVQLGEMVRVGDVWKLTQVPRPSSGATIQVTQGILMRSAAPTGAIVTQALTPQMQKTIEQLQKLDARPPGPNTPRTQVLNFLKQRTSLIRSLVSQSRRPEEYDTWMRQLVNAIASEAQAGNPASLNELTEVEREVRARDDDSPLIPYAVYRRLLGQYNIDLQQATDARSQAKVQQAWLTGLENFVRQYSKAEDAPDAMLQIAIDAEFSNDLEKADKWYQQLISAYADSPAGARAKGAVRRLGLNGKSIALAGPNPSGQQVSLERFRGRLTLVVFWAQWSRQSTDEIPVLKGLYQQYRPKGFDIVGVSLDSSPDEVGPYLQKQGIPWANIYQPGVFSSPLAQQFGILSVPTMFLIDRDGKVISNGITMTELKKELRSRL